MKFIDFEKMAALFLKYWDKFLIDGVEYTLALAAITVAFGAVFASVLALMKMSKIPPLRWLSTIYIEIIRGTPMLLQLYFFYFGLPVLIPALTKQKFLCIAIALICNSAAYVSEVIRSGIQAVDPGQKEAALSLGFSESRAMWFVVVPPGGEKHPASAGQRVYHDRQGHVPWLHVFHRRPDDPVPGGQGRHIPADRAADDRGHHLFPDDVPAQQAVRPL